MVVRNRRDSIKEWLSVLGPILVGLVTGLSFVISAYITNEPAVVYEMQQTPYFEQANTIELFPLKTNNAWYYYGKVEITDYDHGGKAFEKEVQLTMQVIEEISAQDLSLFIMHGHWRDLYNYWPLIKKDQAEPIVIPANDYGYLVVSNKIYYIPPEHLGKAIDFMRTNDNLIAPIEPVNLEFEFPLFKGQRYGAAPAISRKDFNFCWYVNDEVYNHIPAENQIMTMPSYTLVFNSIAEYLSLTFESYRGITAFDYHLQDGSISGQLRLNSYDLK